MPPATAAALSKANMDVFAVGKWSLAYATIVGKLTVIIRPNTINQKTVKYVPTGRAAMLMLIALPSPQIVNTFFIPILLATLAHTKRPIAIVRPRRNKLSIENSWLVSLANLTKYGNHVVGPISVMPEKKIAAINILKFSYRPDLASK